MPQYLDRPAEPAELGDEPAHEMSAEERAKYEAKAEKAHVVLESMAGDAAELLDMPRKDAEDFFAAFGDPLVELALDKPLVVIAAKAALVFLKRRADAPAEENEPPTVDGSVTQ